MNSLHNFDRSLDKFLAWLSEAESSMEGLEAEADRLGGRRDQGALRRPQHQLKVSPIFACTNSPIASSYRLGFCYVSRLFLIAGTQQSRTLRRNLFAVDVSGEKSRKDFNFSNSYFYLAKIIGREFNTVTNTKLNLKLWFI